MLAMVELGEVTLFMAIFDTIPVILFMLGMGYVIKMAYGRLTPGYMALLSGGTFVSFFGGFFKCLWKLVIVCFQVDYVAFDRPFSVYQGIGFVMIAIALVSFVINDKKGFAVDKKQNAVVGCSALGLLAFAALPEVEPSFLWFVVMCLATLVYLTALAICCFRRKMVLEGILLFVSAIGMIAMGGLGSKFKPGQEWASMNWLAEVLNTVVQLAMCYPAIKLCKKFKQIKTDYVLA